MDPFVLQLAELCRRHMARTKWVIVPSHAVGRTLGERIARGGTDWFNLRFVTPLDLAARMGAPFLVERGIDPSEEGLGPALVMRLLLELPLGRGYFRELADQPTLAQAMWTTIREVRLAGLRATDLKPEAFASPAKYEELRALLGAYEAHLASNHRADMATLYEEALAHSDWCPVRPGDLWTTLPHVVWSPLQMRLIDSLPGERSVPRTVALRGTGVPRRLDAEQVERVDTDPASAPLAYLRAPAASGSPRTDVMSLFHAGGREAEIEEVFRRILALRVPLDEVEIVCASDAHVALVWEKAMRHDLPVTLGPGIPAAQTRPGRALIGLCDWIETHFSAGHFRRLLQSGDLGIEADDEGFTASQAARILARAEAGWGRDTYRLALGHLEKEYAATADDPDESDEDRKYAQERADLTAAVRTWICGLIDSIPSARVAGPAESPLVPLVGIVDAALAFLDRTTARKSALDHRAAAAIADHVAELKALGSFSCTLREGLRFLRERVAGLSVAPDRPRPGHLFAGSLAQACYSGRPHLFVVGLEEGRVFPGGTEDPVLLDEERAAISPALRRASDGIDEAVFTTLARLASWSGEHAVASGLGRTKKAVASGFSRTASRITFSYSCRDTREFRETYASWLMLQAYRLQQGDPAATYQQMKAALGEPKSLVPDPRDVAIAPGGWWLKSVAGTGEAGAAPVDARFPFLGRGRVAAARRASDAFTEYDGLVPAAGLVLDPCAPGMSFSVTELEAAAACPFRLFLKRGLGIRPVAARERDPDVWLDPLTRGAELHDLYALALRRARAEGRRIDLVTDGSWLRERAEERLRELEREMPPATSEIRAREWADFLADVELFVEHEAARPGDVIPVAFEVSFGRPLDDDAEPLAREEPVTVTLGEGLTFRIAGRIDRIDEAGDGFEVIDYKTGSFYRPRWSGTFKGGRRLQHALYALAAVELLKGRYRKPTVSRGVYYFSSHKGRAQTVAIPAPPLATTAAVLGELREVIRHGRFVHARAKEDCKFCDYEGACSGTLEKRAETKLQDEVLEAFVRLGDHE